MSALLSRSSTATLIAVLCWFTSANAHADDNADVQYPGLINGLDLEGGYRWQLAGSDKDAHFYRATYRGALLDAQGTPFHEATHIDLDQPKLIEAAGDRNQVAITLQDGGAQLGGGLFDAAGLMPIRLAGLEHLRLRGAASVAGDLDGNGYRITAGLETPPLRIPGLAGSGASNWLTFGLAGQRIESTDNTNDSQNGIATANFFVGKAFGWHKRGNVHATADRIRDLMLEAAPTRAAAVQRADKLKAIPPQQRSLYQQLLLDALDESTSESEWASTLEALATGTADAITDQPTLALYAEGSGWYDVSRSDTARERKGLLTVTGDYWFLADHPNVFLRLRYELGYERAKPDERLNQLMVSVSVRL